MFNSPIRMLPYKRKDGERDYQSLRLSKARKRKIEHLQKLLANKNWSKGRALHYAIHGMNMAGNDIVAAMED